MQIYFILKTNYDFVTSVKANGMQEPNWKTSLHAMVLSMTMKPQWCKTCWGKGDHMVDTLLLF